LASDVQLVNIVLVALDPETVNDVFDPGTTTEIHPPLSTACVFSNALFVNTNGRRFDVGVSVETKLMEPPSPPAFPSLNMQSLITVDIESSVFAVTAKDPPFGSSAGVAASEL
jgi:hypothetical protein